MKTNIFLNSYQQPENKLTYNFFGLLEILNSKALIEYLIEKQVTDNPIVNIETIYGGGESNPDGSFDVRLSDGKLITVFYENKTFRRGVDIGQLESHLKRATENDLLLVTTPRKSDIANIRLIANPRVVFKTWQEISGFISKNFSGHIIASQFIEYGSKTGEFDELGELVSEEIKLVSEYYKINLHKKIKHIFDHAVAETIFSEFGFNNVKVELKDEWGRIGCKISLKEVRGQIIYFGAIALYYDTEDHAIQFKTNCPEIAFFWDISPDYKQQLRGDSAFTELVEKLKSDGFESNLFDELTNNQWRLLVYRRPITDFRIINVYEITKFIEKVMACLAKHDANKFKYFSEFA